MRVLLTMYGLLQVLSPFVNGTNIFLKESDRVPRAAPLDIQKFFGSKGGALGCWRYYIYFITFFHNLQE